MDTYVDFLHQDEWVSRVQITQALPQIVNNLLPELKSRPLRAIKKMGQMGHTLDNLYFATTQVSLANTSDPLTQSLYQVLESLSRFDDFCIACQEDGRLSDALFLVFLEKPEAFSPSLLKVIDWRSLQESSLLIAAGNALSRRKNFDYYYPLLMNRRILGEESCCRSEFIRELLSCIAQLTATDEITQLDLLNAWCCLLAIFPKSKLFTKDTIDALIRLSLSALRTLSFDMRHVAGSLLGRLATEEHTHKYVIKWLENGLHNKLADMIDVTDISLNYIVLKCLEQLMQSGLMERHENIFEAHALENVLRSANGIGLEASLATSVLVDLQDIEQSQEVLKIVSTELKALCHVSKWCQKEPCLRPKLSGNDEQGFKLAMDTLRRTGELRHQCLLARILAIQSRAVIENAQHVEETKKAFEGKLALLAGELESERLTKKQLEDALTILRSQMAQFAVENEKCAQEREVLRVDKEDLQRELDAAKEEIARLYESLSQLKESSAELASTLFDTRCQLECERDELMAVTKMYQEEKDLIAVQLCTSQADCSTKNQQLETLKEQYRESLDRLQQLEEGQRQTVAERVNMTETIATLEDSVAALRQQLSECQSQFAIGKIQESHLVDRCEQAKQVIQQKEELITKLQYELHSLLSPTSHLFKRHAPGSSVVNAPPPEDYPKTSSEPTLPEAKTRSEEEGRVRGTQ